MKKISRFEINKKVRQLFSRYRVNMAELQYSCSGRNLRLSGKLVKEEGGELRQLVLEKLVNDILSLGVHLVCELENLEIIEGMIVRNVYTKEEDEKKRNQSAFGKSVDEATEAS